MAFAQHLVFLFILISDPSTSHHLTTLSLHHTTHPFISSRPALSPLLDPLTLSPLLPPHPQSASQLTSELEEWVLELSDEELEERLLGCGGQEELMFLIRVCWATFWRLYSVSKVYG